MLIKWWVVCSTCTSSCHKFTWVGIHINWCASWVHAVGIMQCNHVMSWRHWWDRCPKWHDWMSKEMNSCPSEWMLKWVKYPMYWMPSAEIDAQMRWMPQMILLGVQLLCGVHLIWRIHGIHLICGTILLGIHQTGHSSHLGNTSYLGFNQSGIHLVPYMRWMLQMQMIWMPQMRLTYNEYNVSNEIVAQMRYSQMRCMLRVEYPNESHAPEWEEWPQRDQYTNGLNTWMRYMPQVNWMAQLRWMSQI